ncbi:S-layer homology domain-containing protein [Metasolibacillus meyeri]|uniref:S-layer homology domain-containing protein n=1 Tax=Metasolibacillus meyeri TaxID=1071052 RepID=A0AAW9NSD6_9BACL|nr:S-layer homology domain-containing protein [Metasolibacillus meyeri]MEC1177753.1 S-layer homology domain-containing protein [Metasolibacillus meyeri]
MKKLLSTLLVLLLVSSAMTPVAIYAEEQEDVGAMEDTPAIENIEGQETEEQQENAGVSLEEESKELLVEEIAPVTKEQPTVETQYVTVPQKLADVSSSFWAKNEVMQLVEIGAINGYPDGEFRPALTISVGQSTNLLKGALQLPEAPYQAIFKDVSEKSSFAAGVFSTYKAGIFKGKKDGNFGVADSLTREMMASALVNAFHLKDTGEAITFKDWDKISPEHRENVKILAQHGITTGREDGSYDPHAVVNRVTFAVMIHRALVMNNEIVPKDYTIETAQHSKFTLFRKEANFAQVTKGDSPLFIRAELPIKLEGTKTENFGVATDTIYTYKIGSHATLKATVRHLTNGDEFVFSTLTNTSEAPISVDLFQKQGNVTNFRLYRYDRFPISKNTNDVFGYDSSSYPTGMMRFMTNDKLAGDRMVGQAYRSKQLTQKYDNGGVSYMRDLRAEYEALSYTWLGTDLFSFYTLTSKGQDIVDTWYMDSNERLFNSDDSMNKWMIETAANYKKRNNWYTAEGPFNKMATTTEPMPKNYQGFGRNLLLVKEDRALVLFKEQGDRYFANLVKNSFISLQKFKGNKTYWETEVTSTYLKGLYGIHAPFIDTRFNEQIALFYYNSGAEFDIPNYREPLRNYADLIVSQRTNNNVIRVSRDAYYIPDYFPVKQNVTTHTSMNHLLGGMNILLLAYNEFGDAKYLETATAVQKALATEKNKWIRDNGDIWYRVNKEGQFAGTDYQHLTLEDLIHSYRLWKDIDTTYLYVLEEMIASKAGYLSANQLGYTMKIKNGLEAIDMMHYLPEGPLYTDAL